MSRPLEVELRALAAASQDVDLVAKHSVLEHQLASGRFTSRTG
jgi:hypothetical protein